MTILYCANSACGHPEAAHNKGAACRIGGCPCQGFDDGVPKAQPPRMRRVAIDVPDGYTLSISLIPWQPDLPVVTIDPETAERAEYLLDSAGLTEAAAARVIQDAARVTEEVA